MERRPCGWCVSVLGVVLVLFASVGCTGPTRVSVSVAPSEVALAPGESVVFTATVLGAQDESVMWSASGGDLVPSGLTATFTAPAELGEYTVTATSQADPGRRASAVVTVGLSDGGIASLVVRPGSVTFVEVGEEAVLEVLAFDARGAPVSLVGRAVEWRIGDSSAVDLMTDPDGPARATVRASAALGSAVVSVAVGPDGEVLSKPVGVSVASVVPDVELVRDEAVVFPFVGLPPGADPASFSTLDYEVVDGVASVAGFTEDEIVVLLVVEENTLQYPAILSGVAPAVGDLLLGTGGSGIMGRVRSVETREGAHLVQLAQVALDEVFEAFVFSFDSAELEAQGVLTPSSWLGLSQAASIAPSATSIPIADCEFEGDVTLLGVAATIEQSLAPILELRYDLLRPKELRFLVGVRGSLAGEVDIDVQGNVAGKISCDAGSSVNLTMSLPAGPLAAVLSAGAKFQPMFKVAVEASAGPRLGVLGRLEVDRVLQAGFDIQDGSVENLSRISGVPSAEIDLIADPDGFGDMNFGVTPGYYFVGAVGVQFGGWTLERVCAGARLLPRLGGWCEGVSDALFLEAFEGSIGGELQTVWDSPRRVLNQEDSASRILAAAVSDVVLKNDALNEVLKRFKFEAIELELVSAQIEGPTLYRVFEAATIELTTPSFGGAVAQGHVAEVAVGDAVQVVVTGARRPAYVPQFDTDLESGEVWIAAGNRVASIDVTVVGGDSLAIDFVVTEALCSKAVGGLVPLRFIGYNRMLGLVPTAGYLGDIRLDCVTSEPPAVAVTIAPDAVTLAPSATQAFTASVTGAADTSVTWSATCGSIAGSSSTITYTAPATAGSCSVTATSVADPSKSASATVTVTSGTPTAGADLVVRDLSVTPTAAVAGANVTVAFSVANVGDAPALASTVRVRINDDPTSVTTSDTLLAELGTNALADGQSQTYTQAVTAPSGLADGTYYVWVVADVFNEANQSSYDNDRGVVPIVIGGANDDCRDPEQPISFPDAGLRDAIVDTLELLGWGGSVVDCGAMAWLPLVNGRDYGISDLWGLEYAVNATDVNLAVNRIEDLAPLRSLDRLAILDLDGNEIVDLAPLADLDGLVQVWLSDNRIQDLAGLGSQRELRFLYLNGNDIRDIEELATLDSIEWLDLDHNSISDIAPLANLRTLTGVSLLENSVADIRPLRDLDGLTGLNLTGNDIVDIGPLADLDRLVYLDLAQNRIVQLSPLENLTALRSLNLRGNRIVDVVPLVLNTGLGQGDQIDLSLNCLDLADGSTASLSINVLEGRGADVIYLPQANCD
jgi:Leucine-rich repeat (LRR) protein